MNERYGGIETGGSWCVCALGTGPDRLETVEKFPTAEPRETVARITGFFERHARPRAIGVAGFGPIELDPAAASWGTLGATPKPGWAGWPLGPALRDALGVPVVVETDVGAAALAERRWGAGRGCDSLCYLTVGTGIGAGLLHGGASVVLAETLGSTAAMLTLDPEKELAVGLEINANHIRGVRSGTVTGTARMLHLGRTTQVWEIRIENEEGALVCISRITMAVVAARVAGPR